MDTIKASPLKRPWALSMANALSDLSQSEIGISPEETIDYATIAGKKSAPKVKKQRPLEDYLAKSPEALENIAYGTPLTKAGDYGLPKLKESTKDAMMVGADVLPVAGRALKIGAKGAEMGSSAIVRALTGNKSATPWGVVDEVSQMVPMPAIFAGQKAKTADLGKLDRARMLHGQGADPEAIRKETGWVQFPDGNWRFEIDDSKSAYNYGDRYKQAMRDHTDKSSDVHHAINLRKRIDMDGVSASKAFKGYTNEFYGVRPEAKKLAESMSLEDLYRMRDSVAGDRPNHYNLKLGDVLDHPELYEAYPHMREMPFEVRDMPARGAYGNGRIALNSKEVMAEPSMISKAGGYTEESSPRSILLHEATHGVQDFEGHARGGSPYEFMPEIQAKIKEADSKVSEINRQLSEASDAGDMDRYHKLLDQRQELVSQAQADPMDIADRAYRQLAGETEARLTQRRLNLPKEGREAIDPIKSFDVPTENQVIRFRGDSDNNALQLALGEDENGYRRIPATSSGSQQSGRQADQASDGRTRPDMGAVRGLIEDGQARGYRGSANDPSAYAEVKRLIATPDENPAVQLARQFNPNFKLDTVKAMPPSSMGKQMAVSKAYDTLWDSPNVDPKLKSEIFARYLNAMPEMVRKSGATNYDELTEAAYEKLRGETQQQFDAMRGAGWNMSYHNDGRGDYRDSQEMLIDALLNKHLYTFGGGDIHKGLNAIDPSTGLNSNEMFRAVHDLVGHGTTGSTFGRKGEELAYGAHSETFSPLAKIAAGTETRGQNSFVNYSGINAETLYKMAKIREELATANRREKDPTPYINALKSAGQNWNYAPQSPFLLPPEMLSLDYRGGMPDYMKPYIQPKTPVSQEGFHWSHSKLSETDPRYNGTGIKGEEQGRSDLPNFNERTYFYNDPQSREAGLGSNQHGANLEDLYDLKNDPEKIGITAFVENFDPAKGVANRSQMLNDQENAIKDAGYRGYRSTGASALFYPQVVKHLRKVE